VDASGHRRPATCTNDQYLRRPACHGTRRSRTAAPERNRGLKEAGNDSRAVCIEKPGAFVQRTPGLLSAAQADRIEPTPLDVHRVGCSGRRIRSGISRSAPHTRHHCRRSASLGACLADSIRLVFASCQSAAADSARAVRPASRRMSRSRSASCCLARWTLDDGEMATAVVVSRLS